MTDFRGKRAECGVLDDACCDRCGMLYLEDHGHVTAVGGKRVYLCPECREKLDKFMKMEEEKND